MSEHDPGRWIVTDPDAAAGEAAASGATAGEATAAAPADPLIDGPDVSCPRCGAPVAPGQDWCLNCGAAVTTEVAGPRGWRAPVAIVAVVLLVAAGALVYAFLQISDNADQVAQAPAPATTPAAVPAASPSPAPSPSPTATASATATSVPGTTTTSGPTGPTGPTGPITTPTTTGSFASWPAGTTAYTVVLWSASTRAEAETKARELQSKGQSPGILHSDDYPSLRPGYWVVFSGQYPTRAQAQSAATAAQSAAPGAYARQVKPR